MGLHAAASYRALNRRRAGPPRERGNDRQPDAGSVVAKAKDTCGDREHGRHPELHPSRFSAKRQLFSGFLSLQGNRVA